MQITPLRGGKQKERTKAIQTLEQAQLLCELLGDLMRLAVFLQPRDSDC